MNYINHNTRGRRRGSHHLFILSIFLFSLILRPVVADNNGKKESKDDQDMQGPSLVERAIGITGLNSRWDAIRTWAKLAWMNLRPPDSKNGQSSDSANVVKEAAVRSFETSKETVEQAAASAAMAAGEAMEKTKEKLKRSLSSERGSKAKAEL